MAEAARSRRSVLGSLILSLTGAAALWRFLTPQRSPGSASGDWLSVPETEVPPHGALVLPELHCAVVREGPVFLALDLTCTHLGCTVAATPQGFACPCHGSRFGSDGGVLKGPAPRPMRRLRLDRDAGRIRVMRS
jgi:cytochrome b6-f complex iron-sulfur subunit